MMATLDWIFLAVVLLSMLMGAWRGFVVEVLSLLNWGVAFVAAQWLAPDVAPHLPMAGASEMIRYAAAFVLVFVLAVFAGAMLVWLAGKFFSLAALRPADRALGAVFGLMRGVVLLLALAVVVGMSPLKSEPWWLQAQGARWVTATVKGLKPVLPQEFAKYLP